MSKVLIAGASGLVGAAAVDKFLDDGYDVIAVSRRKPEVESDRPFEHLPVDLRDTEASKKAFGKLSDVTHVVYTAVYEKPGLIPGWQVARRGDGPTYEGSRPSGRTADISSRAAHEHGRPAPGRTAPLARLGRFAHLGRSQCPGLLSRWRSDVSRRRNDSGLAVAALAGKGGGSAIALGKWRGSA